MIDPKVLERYAILGELSLDGAVQPVKGILPIVLSKQIEPFKGLICPGKNANEAALTKSNEIIPVTNLSEAVHLINNPELIRPFIYKPIQEPQEGKNDLDFSDVKGQWHVKRGLEIAAAGAHNCIMIGPPGVGKSMLAKRLPGILPEMSLEESLETTKIYSVTGLKPTVGLIKNRPFRSPHHTTSVVCPVWGAEIV